MNNSVAGPAGFPPVAVTRNQQSDARLSIAFISWLRRTRRSAWFAIGLCLLFRVGDALVHNEALPSGSPAMAMGMAR